MRLYVESRIALLAKNNFVTGHLAVSVSFWCLLGLFGVNGAAPLLLPPSPLLSHVPSYAQWSLSNFILLFYCSYIIIFHIIFILIYIIKSHFILKLRN